MTAHGLETVFVRPQYLSMPIQRFNNKFRLYLQQSWVYQWSLIVCNSIMAGSSVAGGAIFVHLQLTGSEPLTYSN